MTSEQHFWKSHDRLVATNAIMLRLLFGANQLTPSELRALIDLRPHIYDRFAGYGAAR